MPRDVGERAIMRAPATRWRARRDPNDANNTLITLGFSACQGSRVDARERRLNAQRHQTEYDRLAALRINAGPSNPQHSYVGAGHAKVHQLGRGGEPYRCGPVSLTVSHQPQTLPSSHSPSSPPALGLFLFGIRRDTFKAL